MITRWRIEAESPDKERVEEDIEFAARVLEINGMIDEGRFWKRTDQFGPQLRDSDGEAVFYMRRVYSHIDNGGG